MLSKLYNFIFDHKLRKNLSILSFQNYSIVEKPDTKISNETNWTAATEVEILKVLNSSTVQELSRYTNLSLAELIVKYRKANGPYNSLNDLHNHVEYNILSKFYASISEHKKEVKKWKKYMATPDIKTIPVPKSIVGIHVGPTSISWTLVTCDRKILDWDYMKWSNKTEKLSTYQLVNVVLDVVQQLPSSHCYVLEDLQATTKSLRNIVNNQQQFNVAIMSCLKLIDQQRISDELPVKNSVYILRPLTTAKFFNLHIGNEVIAAEYMTNKLLYNPGEGDTKLYSICVNNEVKEKFKRNSAEYKEQIGWSLLKALTFIRQLALFNTSMPYAQSIR